MATYRFTLTTPEGTQTFGADQIQNWSDITPSYVVNETYRGIFREFTSTFEFVSDARRSIIRAFDKYGYDVDIFLTIEAGNDNGEFSSFRQLAYRLRADIQGIEIGDLTVSVNFIDSGFVANIMNREDMEVNLQLPDAGKIESVDGESVQAVDRLLWNTRLHDRRLIYITEYEKNDFSGVVDQTSSDMGTSKTIAIPLDANYVSAGANKTIPHTISDYADPDGADLYAIIPDSEYPGQIKMKGNVKGSFYFPTSDLSGQFRWDLIIFITYSDEKQNETGSLGETVNLLLSDESEGYAVISSGVASPVNEYINFDVEIDKTFNLEKNDSLVFGLFMYKDYNPTTWKCETTIQEAKVNLEQLAIYPSTLADVILPYELFTQLLQTYTGQQKTFYSEFFGRKDLGYEENGPGAGVAVATGKMIRGFPYGEKQGDEKNETLLNTSFKDAFESYNKIFNLAATVETIGQEQRVRIEPMEYFRNFEVLADIGDNINEISRKVNPDKIYSDLQFGYKNKEYEELNGLFSFNGEMGFSTPLQTEAESLELINEWRADDIGIELTRRMQYEDNPSEDYRSDDDIFFIDCQIFVSAISDDYYIYPKRGSNYDSVSGVFEPDWAYNLNLSPKRCLYNWQEEIKAGLSFKPNQSLKYIKGPKNPNLISKAPSEVEIVESEDVLISTLKNAKFIPEIIQISEAPLTIKDWENIKENRYGVIALKHKGVRIYGFVMEVEFEINKKTANFELLRANM